MDDQPTPIAEDDSKPSFAAVVTEGADAPPSAAAGGETSAGGDPAAEPAEGASKDYGAVKQAEGATTGDAPINPQVRKGTCVVQPSGWGCWLLDVRLAV